MVSTHISGTAVQSPCYNSDSLVVFKKDISKTLVCVLWLSLIHWSFGQLWTPPRLPSIQNSFRRFLGLVLNKQHNRIMVDQFMLMIYVHILSDYVFSVELSSERILEVIESLLPCNICAVQEMCSWASPDAIIHTKFNW